MSGSAVYEFDVVVVGSGPGGATVARELSGAGKKVALLERGEDHKNLGGYTSALKILDGHGLLRSKEGMPILRAITTGGSTVVYSASAAKPPPWLKTRYEIDLDPWMDEIMEETGAGDLPEELVGEASTRVMETANKIGYDWETMPKFLDPSHFKDGKCCGTNTHLGCKCGAKWTAREYIKDAVDRGASLYTKTDCKELLVENGVARGVKAVTSGKEVEYRADLVVSCAGGIGSPVLLKQAGIEEAGEGCFVDPTVVTYGEAPFRGIWRDPPVSVVSWEFYDSHGIRMGTMVEPSLLLAMNMALYSPRHIGLGINYDKTVGILAKVKDDLSGYVDADGRVSKPMTEADHGRLDKGREVATDILRDLGCKPKSIVSGDVKGAHPSGTCRIGHVVDDNLATQIKNLYVCDASVFPEALDRPTVITIIGLAKRLSRHLLDA